jgi:endonuclease YncB( thermonuclease family)
MAYYNQLNSKIRNLLGWLFLLAMFLVAIFLSFYSDEKVNIQNLNGRATASDGDSLRLNGERIRLLGIDAPELYQNCKAKNGRNWECGRVSHKRMSKLIKGQRVVCSSNEVDRYDRLLAKCTVLDKDIGGILVLEGLAVSYRGSGDYLGEQRSAKKNKLGMWAGEFENPQDWRRNNPRRN